MELSIYPIHMGLDTVYAVKGEGVILIDGGFPHKLANLKDGLAKTLIQPEEIKLIILTHGHWDHIGSARDIKQLTGARVLMHEKDVHYLAEVKQTSPTGFTPWGKIMSALLNLITPFIHVPTFEVDIVAGDEELSLSEYGIPGRLICTPGHTWGSVSVLLAMNLFPLRLNPGLPIYGDDIQLVKNSWKKLLDMGAKIVYPAHGKPFLAQVMRKLIA
jgi:glyoxylase-like metal-dependent hydrolase (beta-lactamase superfamily II)